jgi:hypothetical protein
MVVVRGGQCRRHTLAAVAVAGGTFQLRETVQSLTPAPTAGISLSSCTTLTGTARTTVLLRGMNSSNVFTFVQSSGTAATAVADVAAVRINLTRRLPEGRRPISKTTQVSLRNFGTTILRSN